MDQLYIMSGIVLIGITFMSAMGFVAPLLREAENFPQWMMLMAPLVIAVILGGWLIIIGFDDDEFMVDKDIPRSEPWREEE